MKIPPAPRFAHIGNVLLFDEVPSTNDMGKAIAEKMLAEGDDLPVTALVARHQSAGRGREGRAWAPPPRTAVCLSLVVPWPAGPARVRLPVDIGIRVARGLTARFGLEARLKWPNDVLVSRKKIAGILVEARSSDSEGYAVIGIGINVTSTREDLDAAGLPDATSLAAEGVPIAALAGDGAVFAILELLDAQLGATLPPLHTAFEEVSAHAPGDAVTVTHAGRSVTGAYRGVTPDGFLRLQTGSGEETLVAGEVTLF